MTRIRLALALAVCGAALAAACGSEREDGGRERLVGAVVWAVGDGADGGLAAKQLAERMGRGRVDHLLYLGDVYEHGTPEEFARNYEPIYGRWAKRTAPTPGNHEWRFRAQGYFPYWTRVLGRPQPLYYSFAVEGWQILSLNSEDPRDARQLRWLRAQLSSPGNCRIAFWHRARFSAGSVHGDNRGVRPLWDALRGKAPLVVSAHEHNLQRLRPLDGIIQLVSGAGGHRLYPLNRQDPRLVWGDDKRYGAVRLELSPGRARFAFVDSAGEVLHRGEVACRRGAP